MVKKAIKVLAVVAVIMAGAWYLYKEAYMSGARAGYDYALYRVQQEYICLPINPEGE